MAQRALLPGYMLIGGRPGRIIVSIIIRDGVVWSQSSSVDIETYWHNIPDFNPNRWFEYIVLVAVVHRVPASEIVHPRQFDSQQLNIHPSYVIGRPGGCEVCILGYLYITPEADQADIRRLTQINLSCLTRIRPCVDELDIMPAAWKQYLAEHPQAAY